jgi:GSH-dependent disulfide-bond oxidoreductase
MAGGSYSIADIAGFNIFAGLPVMNAELVNDSRTPHLMEWLRTMYERPAAARSLALGRTEMVRRYTHLARNGAAHA